VQQEEAMIETTRHTQKKMAQAPRAKHAEDFTFGETLGHGSFGDVVKAVDKETGQEYAIKIIEKALVVKLNKQKYVVTERDILCACNHPNIVKLYYTFRSESSLHYVLELCPGGELLHYIRQTKTFSMPVAQFYTAEIVNALEHLHNKGFVHRDLKPENVLLSATMHVKLTDFGTAKNLKTEATDGKARSNSFVGTAEYVPPEILTASAASEPGEEDEVPMITTAADLWSLGCMTYQMLTGRYPFRGKSEMLTFEKIKNRELYIPPNLPAEAADFINKLLVVDPTKRLGAGNDFASLKAHPFFAGITFDGLWKQTPPPFEPFPTPLDWSGAEDGGETPAPVVDIKPDPAMAAMAMSSEPANEGEKKTELTVDSQATKDFEEFLKPGEDVYLMRNVQRLYAFRSKRQIMLLTSAPRILFLSANEGAATKLVKEIPWSMSLSFGVTQEPAKFFIQVGNSKKKFKDLEHNASKALTAFEQVMCRHRQFAVPDQ